MVEPRNGGLCPSLANAHFSVLVHEENRFYVAEVPDQVMPGRYHFSLHTPSSGIQNMQVEVVLLFGYHPGAEFGQPCPRHKCTYGEVGNGNVYYSGDVVELTSTAQSLFSWPGLNKRKCAVSSLARATGGIKVSGSTFGYLNAACGLDSVHHLTTGVSRFNSDALRPLIWIKMIGDSNTRHMYLALSKRLKLGNCLSDGTPSVPERGACWGSYVLLTYSSYFIAWDEDEAISTLSHLLSDNLPTFVQGAKFARTQTWHPYFDDPNAVPGYIFVSFGSHSQIGRASCRERVS